MKEQTGQDSFRKNLLNLEDKTTVPKKSWEQCNAIYIGQTQGYFEIKVETTYRKFNYLELSHLKKHIKD